jgi:uncharacterized membrane protein required for colicin V production
MASIIILVVMAGCAAFQLFKGNFVRAFATFMAALCANIVAFGWLDQLSSILIRNDKLPDWAQAICFLVLFIITFAVLQTLIMTLTRPPIDFGTIPERVGRIVFGLLLGFILSGTLLVIGGLAPLPANYPYQRFEASRPDLQAPKKSLLNPDGFITGWFGITSSGSLSGSQSFAVLHADFLNQLYLDRILTDKRVPVRTEQGTIEVPAKAGAWPAANLKDSSGNPLSAKTGSDLIIVRVGFTGKLVRSGNKFTTGQLRLLCESKSAGRLTASEKQTLKAPAECVYPIGYVKTSGRVAMKGPSEAIILQQSDFKTGPKFIDFAFYIPADTEPAALIFKSNDMVMVHGLVTAEEAPTPMPFMQASEVATDFAKIKSVSAKIYGLELKSGQRLLEGATPAVSDQAQWQAMQTSQSIQPAQFEQGKIVCVRAELKKPTESNQSAGSEQQTQENKLPRMFKIPAGYKMLSLKCNNPAVGAAVTGEQLPVLLDSEGVAHYPCGVVATAKIDNIMTYEVDYCPANLTFANGAVSKPYPDNIWITEKAKNPPQFYALYLVKPGTLISSVRPAGEQTGAAFDGVEMYLVN